MNASEFFLKMDGTLQDMWADAKSENRFLNAILNEEIDRKLYALYLIETFHYTAHNTKNQALVVKNIHPSTVKNIQYMKFCLHHAEEECGHELMALHDLNTLREDKAGVEDMPSALPATELLINKLYTLSDDSNSLARLGYSYWAEGSYKYFQDVLGKLVEKLDLKKGSLTFLVEHSDIDEGHFEEVKEIIEKTATSDDFADIERGMVDSLKWTFDMLEAVYDLHQNTSSHPDLVKQVH